MIAGMDLGGTCVRIAIATDEARILRRCEARTRDLETPERLVAWAAAAIHRMGEGRRIASLGIAAPGPLDPVRGVLLNPPNLVGWQDVPLADMCAAAMCCPAHLENDANLAAWGEFKHGAGRGATNMVYVTWSTGVGAGLVLEHRLFSGSNGVAGEIGHTIIDPAGPLDSCGQRGCVEAFCGGRALETQTGRSAEALFEAAAQGEPEATAVVERAATYMGYALINLTNLFDPQVIVLGGGVTRSWMHVEPVLTAAVHGSQFIQPARRPALRLAELGGRAGEVGAVAWAREKL
jgi:glucokinase